MSSVAEERVARSVALEKAYVHDVYEQFSDGPRGRPWPKVNQFLADLEPGSLVCDVGCGNGKYLDSNPSVFNIGADKCTRLTKVAREKENEVLVCDNLALPFRDESFDAVLSVAVVHHFATTERRVCALRELARILRIGGRLIISVWAMEQTHRKFESQDVLVPWHRPQTLSTPSLELTSTTNTSEDDVLPPYHAYTQTSDSDSNKSMRNKTGLRKKGRTRHKGRSIDPGRSSSPSSSSLSSPNETCYSFVRRAIQKLAGGKRSGTSHRPWFLDTWNSCTKEPSQKRYDPDGCENYDCGNIQDLPIELRRVDDDEPPQRRQTFPSSQIILGNDLYGGGVKSKSLTDIKTFDDRLIVRSQSSVPSLQQESSKDEEEVSSSFSNCNESKTVSTRSLNTHTRKPKLVKQKQSICDEDAEEALDIPTDMRNLVNALPDFRVYHGNNRHRGSVFKQSSMNEELMSTERLREKERVKRNITKQASLNEDLMYQRHALDSLRDSIFSVSTSKRFQLIKSGFTNTLKNSTTNIEKVAGSSLKNGFVRMFQGWKGNEFVVSPTTPDSTNPELTTNNLQATAKPVAGISDEKKDKDAVATTPGERRHSREDGSDSSKDSSLQSDTSVDSEDSFASVIFVPKTDPLSPTPLSPGPTSPHLKQTSVPNSPRMKQSSCPTSPRIKQMPLTVYPLTKQLSSPKPSTTNNTNTATCKTNNISATSPVVSTPPPSSTIETKLTCTSARDQLDTEEAKRTTPSETTAITQISPLKPPPSPPKIVQTSEPTLTSNNVPKDKSLAQKYSVVMIPRYKKTNTSSGSLTRTITESDITSQIEDRKRTERLRQIRELLKDRPGFGIRASRSAFPIVRHSSVRSGGRIEAIAKPLPRLLSLELFNPETDDKDSDSSGVSSPDSVDSVINIEVVDTSSGSKSDTSTEEKKVSPTKFAFPPIINTEPESPIAPPDMLSQPNEIYPKLSPTTMSLLEAAAEVANSLDDAVDAVIKSSPKAKRKQLQTVEPNEVISVMERQYNTSECHARSPVNNHNKNTILESTWDVECHKHLTDFADKLSEKLLLEIDQYQEQSKKQEPKEVKFNVASTFQHIDDPYIHRLSEELNDLNKLSAEIQKQNQYLSQLSKSDLAVANLINPGILVANDFELCMQCNSKQCKCCERIHSVSDSDKTKSDKVPYCIKNKDKDIAEAARTVVDQGSLLKDSLVTVCEDVPTSELIDPPVALGIKNSASGYHRFSRESSDASVPGDASSTKGLLQFAAQHSIESNDNADISERTTASGGSDSQKDTNSISRYSDGGSTASLASCTEWSRPANHKNISNLRSCNSGLSGCRSASQDKQSDESSANDPMLAGNFGSLNASLSDTSQDSLPSDNIGGAITYHRYYHVFREGELDQLIERYVENLHIISSYYDHASWCVVAEKVQVWTI